MSFDESQVEIVEVPQRRIVYVERRSDAQGSFEQAAPEAIHAIMDYINANNIPVDWSTFMGIVPDDMRTERANKRYWAALEIGEDVVLPPAKDVETGVLAGGRELTYTARGAYDGLPEWWSDFEAYRARHNYPFRGPAYEVYVDEPGSTPEDEMRTILHLPLHG